jgi:hypothetical protein
VTPECFQIDCHCNDTRLRDGLLIRRRCCSHQVRCVDLRFLGRQGLELHSLNRGAAILLSVVEDITDPLSAHVIAEAAVNSPLCTLLPG